ncbi:MAG: hypothetical protein RQ750_16805 [Roseovarius sp.]|nr:hypothetical protein [Roseovarius sp.]
MTLHEALKALNKAAYDAIRAGRDTTMHPDLDRQSLREIVWTTDKLVEKTRQKALKDAVQAFSHLDLPPTGEGDEFEDGWIAAENAIRREIDKLIEGEQA